MKKFITPIIGVALFVAGYHYVHRHADYVSTKTEVSTAAPSDVKPLKLRPIFALRLNNSFAGNGKTSF